MNRLLMTSAAVLSFASVAMAADLPRRNQPPVAPVMVAPAFSWTGLYAGVNAGYGWSADDKARFVGNPAAMAFVNAGTLPGGFAAKSRGFVGGGQIGANYQYGRFVVGAETDLQYAGQRGTGRGFSTAGDTVGLKHDTHYLGTARARLGFTPVDRWLVYATGGLAYGNVKNAASYVSPSNGGGTWYGSKSDTKAGWTVGAGTEYAFTNQLSGKLEYLYYDLGSSNLTLAAANAAAAGTGAVLNTKVENRGHLARVGLNYKF